MATANFTIAPDNTSDASFRAWITPLFNAVDAILTHVVQTGELDPATPLTPSAGSQKRGFRCWRFNDAAQATHPIFLRADVGSGSVANQPGLWLRVGNTLDGSGNLGVVGGGNLMSEEQFSLNKTGTSTPFLSHVSGDAGRLTVCLFTIWPTTAEKPWFFNLERCPDINGNYEDKAVGLDIVSVTAQRCYTLTKDGRSVSTLINSNQFFPWPYDDSEATALIGRRVGCFPPLRIARGRVYNAVTGWLMYHNADYDGIGEEPLAVYGSNKNYYVSQRGLALIASTSQVHRVLLRND